MYSKTGGLADMAGALAKFLSAQAVASGIGPPALSGNAETISDIRPFDWKFDLPFGPDRIGGRIVDWTSRSHV